MTTKTILKEQIKEDGRRGLYPSMVGILTGMIKCNSTNEELRQALKEFKEVQNDNNQRINT